MAENWDKTHVCDTCFFVFGTREMLEDHKRNSCINRHVHRKEFNLGEKTSVGNCDISNFAPRDRGSQRGIVCEICNESFTDIGAFNLHLLTHGEKKPFVCDVCCLMFSDEQMLRDHHLTHTGVKPHSWPQSKKAQDSEQYNAGTPIIIETAAAVAGNQSSGAHLLEPLPDVDISVHCQTHECNICGEEFRERLMYTAHMLTHGYNTKLFLCAVCEGTVAEEEVRYHMKNHEAQMHRYNICPFCSFVFSKEPLMEHLRRVHIEQEYCECQYCGGVFPSGELLNDHSLAQHMLYVCNKCCIVFPNSRSLQSHVQRHSSDNSTCNNDLTRQDTIRGKSSIDKSVHNNGSPHSNANTHAEKSNMDEQITNSEKPSVARKLHDIDLFKVTQGCKSEHAQNDGQTEGVRVKDDGKMCQNNEKPFKCIQCNESFDSVINVEEHLRNHKEEKPYLFIQFNTRGTLKTYDCAKCKAMFREKEDLDGHMEMHVDKTFHCSNCDEGFVRKSALKKHLLLHLNKGKMPHKCKECGMSFKQKSQLKGHMLTHVRVTAPTDKTFTCDQCHRNFAHSTALKDHMLIHTGEKPHRCTDCDFACRQKSQLKQHKRVHSDERPHQCNECGKSFRHSRTLKEHMLTHNDKKPYACDDCDACFKLKSQLKIHVKLHTDGIMCPKCNTGFTDQSCLEKHMCTDDDDNSYKCMECNSSFVTESQLKKHVLTKHSKERPFQCYLCGKAFKTNSKLKCHMRCVHSEERPFKCTQCNSAYKQKNELNRHMRSHTDERPYLCTMCPWQFREQSMLHRHMQTHSTETHFQCPHCDKAFKQKLNLTSHLVTHSNDKPHQCVQCGKAFKRKTGLKNHMLIHTGEKPYQCNLCGQRFSQKSRIRIHTMRAHTGEKPHHCEICFKRFTTRWDLKLHGKQHQDVRTS